MTGPLNEESRLAATHLREFADAQPGWSACRNEMLLAEGLEDGSLAVVEVSLVERLVAALLVARGQLPMTRWPHDFDWGNHGEARHPDCSVDESNAGDIEDWASDREKHAAAVRASPALMAATAALAAARAAGFEGGGAS